MTFFVWERPGEFIQGLDRDIAPQIVRTMSHLEDCIVEATIMLDLFEQELAKSRARNSVVESRRHDSYLAKAESAIRDASGEPRPQSNQEREVRRFEIEKMAMNLKISDGFTPDDYADKVPKLHAETFVNILNKFSQFLHRVTKLDERDAVKTIQSDFHSAVPNIIGVRNSIAHFDERSIGKSRSKDIKPEALSRPWVNGPAFILRSLDGSKFGMTTEDGVFGEIEISGNTVVYMIETVKKVYGIYDWVMGPCLIPRR